MQKKKYTSLYVLIALLLCVIVSMSALLYIFSIESLLIEENFQYLQEVARVTSESLKSRIEEDLRLAKSVSNSIHFGEFSTLEDINTSLSNLQNSSIYEIYHNTYIIKLSGDAYFFDNDVLTIKNISGQDFFENAIKGKSGIVKSDALGHNAFLIYAPIILENNVSGVVALCRSQESVEKILLNHTFDKIGYNIIVSNIGDKVVSSQHEEIIEFENMFDSIGKTGVKIEELKDNFLNNKSGQLKYKVDGHKRFLIYTPLYLNDWYVLSIAPESVMKAKSDKIIGTTALVTVIIAVSVLGLMVLVLVIRNSTTKSIKKLAYFDSLTGIFNKNFFMEAGKESIFNTDKKYAFVVADIKNFKAVNSIFGFEKGDTVLIQTAKLLSSQMQANEIVARINSDTFYMLLSYNDKQTLIDRIHVIDSMLKEQAFEFVDNAEYQIAIAYGVCFVENKLDTFEAIGDKAILAIKEIKNGNATKICVYDEKLYEKFVEEQEIDRYKNEAIKNNEFVLYLQPKYSIVKQKIIGAEALVRWIHPIKGLIPPIKFIPLFERNAFIPTLDLFMFEQVCKTLLEWKIDGRELIPISVNISRIDFYVKDFIKSLKDILTKYQIEPRYIDIELTESAFVNDAEIINDCISELHDIGFKISMDDFGSGYSSLNMLQEFDIDEMKIDKNFFHEMNNNTSVRIILKNVINMAKDLNITMIAEGVETEEQINFLKEVGCDLIQGYYISKPLPIEAFVKLL